MCIRDSLGRAGLDKKLFGKIWTWAENHKIPSRPLEWRKKYPQTKYGFETEAFWDMYASKIQEMGIKNIEWAKEQIEMRLGYARRLNRLIENIKPSLKKQGIEWTDWMQKVILYYYYPEKMKDSPGWMREFGEILVGCEKLEANSNRIRGKDYYNRVDESFEDAFNYLNKLKDEDRISEKVLFAIQTLVSEGLFDGILKEARNGYISKKELSLRATDLEQTILINIEIDSNEEGKLAVPVKTLLEITQEIPDENLNIIINNDNKVQIQTDFGNYSIMGKSANEFPEIPNVENPVIINMDKNEYTNI